MSATSQNSGGSKIPHHNTPWGQQHREYSEDKNKIDARNDSESPISGTDSDETPRFYETSDVDDSSHKSWDRQKAHRHHKRTRKQSLDAPDEGRRLGQANKHAFLSDEEIANHWFWRFATWLIWPMNAWLTRISWVGLEKLPRDKGALLVFIHSSHNADIPFMLIGFYKQTGRVIRGLLHRVLMFFFPWFAYMGMVPGYRDTAHQLLKQGFWVGVIPGGSEEALRGHENKYNLQWLDKRRGFAKVAIKAGAPIVPCFFQNVDEMRYNPVFHLWNKLRGGKAYQYIVDLKIPIFSEVVKQTGEFLWIVCAFLFGIPVPAKVTCYVGDPVETNEDSDIDEVRDKVYQRMKALIREHQSTGLDRKRAFQMWLDDRKKAEGKKAQ